MTGYQQPPQLIVRQSTSSIEVTGFKPGTKEDMMEMCFSNKRKSGGGDVTSVQMEGDRCIITFASEEGEVIVKLIISV